MFNPDHNWTDERDDPGNGPALRCHYSRLVDDLQARRDAQRTWGDAPAERDEPKVCPAPLIEELKQRIRHMDPGGKTTTSEGECW